MLSPYFKISVQKACSYSGSFVLVMCLVFTQGLFTQAQAGSCISTPCFGNHTPAWPVASNGISKQQAAEIAQQRVPGRVLSVTLKGNSYRVKILRKTGEVVIVFVDARSGAAN